MEREKFMTEWEHALQTGNALEHTRARQIDPADKKKSTLAGGIKVEKNVDSGNLCGKFRKTASRFYGWNLFYLSGRICISGI